MGGDQFDCGVDRLQFRDTAELGGPWRTLEAVEFATLEWVDRFNHRRLLQTIGDTPPVEAEARCYVQTKDVAMAA